MDKITKEQFLAARHRMHGVTADKWSIEDCKTTDRYRKEQALIRLKLKLKDFTPVVRTFIFDMVRYHYGSVEVDEFLKGMDCYNKSLEI